MIQGQIGQMLQGVNSAPPTRRNIAEMIAEIQARLGTVECGMENTLANMRGPVPRTAPDEHEPRTLYDHILTLLGRVQNLEQLQGELNSLLFP